MKKILIVLIIVLAILLGFFITRGKTVMQKQASSPKNSASNPSISNPLAIDVMRNRKYPGSTMTIEQTLFDGTNYHQYFASYLSDGLKIYGLLTVPMTPMPKNGYPAIIFNHGYIPPQQYVTTERYVSYADAFARDGYVVFKPDYRGHGNSEGSPEGGYFSPAYTTDVLDALSTIKKLKDPHPGGEGNNLVVNPNKIGMWGHSMGGNITMRSLVVDPKDIEAAVIWSGVVGTYTQIEHWHDPGYHPSQYELLLRYKFRSNLQQQYGTPESNPTFWNALDPRSYISDIAAPIQIHQSLADEEVPPVMAQTFSADLKKAGKTVEYYEYDNADHNLSQVFDTTMQRSIEFFDKYLK